jgi:hypothetical protein
MRTLKLVLVLAAVLALGYGVAAPWLTVYQIREAADNRDGRALAEHVEFDSVRQSLKDQLNARMLRELGDDIRQNPLAVLGAALANTVVDGLVDTYVTPAGIEQLMRGETPAPGIPRSDPPPAGRHRHRKRYRQDRTRTPQALFRCPHGLPLAQPLRGHHDRRQRQAGRVHPEPPRPGLEADRHSAAPGLSPSPAASAA